jgi:hypothetical protein
MNRILSVLLGSCILLATNSTAQTTSTTALDIWTPRTHNPAFTEPGGSFTVEVKGAATLPASGWKATLRNDLAAWPCAVKSASYGRIHHDTEDGWQVVVQTPATISPELMTLELSQGEKDFYILHQSDQHISGPLAVEPGGKSSKKWGEGSKQALEWMTPVVNLINPRFMIETGDNMHLYFEHNYWCGLDSAKLRVQRFLDGLAGLTIPFVMSTGNHDIGFSDYVDVKEWRATYAGIVGQRAFSFNMGSFYVLCTEWTAPDYLPWAKANYAKAKADTAVKFHLLMSHYYDGPLGYTTVTPTGDSSDLILVGHNHRTKTLQTSPYYALSVGTAQDHQRTGFYNFQRTNNGWASPEVKIHADGVNVHHLVGDNGQPKVAATYENANDGTMSTNKVTIKNDLPNNFYDGRVRLLLKKGTYSVTGGEVLASYPYNRGKNTAVLVRVNIPGNSNIDLTVQKK